MDSTSTYRSPLSTRYASSEMLYNFSEQKKFSEWRQMWYNLAVTQKDWKESNQILHRREQSVVAQNNSINSSNSNDNVRAIKGISSSPQAILLQQYLEQHSVTSQCSDNILKANEALYNIEVDLNDNTLKYKNKNCLDGNVYCVRNAQLSAPIFPMPVDAGPCSNISIVIPHNCGNDCSLYFETLDICAAVHRLKPKLEKDVQSDAFNSELTSLLWCDYKYFPSLDTENIRKCNVNATKSNSNACNRADYDFDYLRKLTSRNDFTDAKAIYGRKIKCENVYQFPPDCYLEIRDMCSAEKAKQFFAPKMPVNDKNVNSSV